MKRTCLSFLVLAGALAAGCGHTGTNSAEGWNLAKSKRFEMYTATTSKHIEALNGLEYHYASLSSSFFKNSDVGTVEVLFLEDDDFKEMFGDRRDFAAIAKVPGGGKIGQNGLLVVNELPAGESGDSKGSSEGERGGSQRRGDDSLAEALTHLFIHRSFPKAPLWFHEGFSAYARGAEFKEGDNNERIACFGYPGDEKVTFLPLEKMFSLSWDEYDSGDARSWYKHTARVLIDYTIHGDGGKNQPALEKLIVGVVDGKPGADIMSDAYPGRAIGELTKAVHGHGAEVASHASSQTEKRGLCPIGFPVPAEKAPDIRDSVEPTPVPAADMKALFEGLRKLPKREDGYPAWFPAEVIAQSDGASAAK